MKQGTLLALLITRTGKAQIDGEHAIHDVTPLHTREAEETHTEECGNDQQQRA